MVSDTILFTDVFHFGLGSAVALNVGFSAPIVVGYIMYQVATSKTKHEAIEDVSVFFAGYLAARILIKQ